MKRVWFAMALAVIGSVPAAAQSNDSGPFVTVGIFAGIDRFSHSVTTQPSGSGETPNLSGTTGGGLFGMGTFLAPRWSASVEFAFSTSTEGTATQSGQSVRQTLQTRSRTDLGSVLLGYHHTPSGKIQVGMFAGLSFVRQSTHSEIDTVFSPPLPIPPLTPTHTETDAIIYRSAATVGFDVAIQATATLAIVPTVRAHVISGMWSIRPGVMVRWRF